MKVRFFARFRDLAGASQVEVEVPEGCSVASLLARLRETYPRLPAAPVPAAVNAEFAGPQHALAEGDEVAFLPPFSGG